VEGVTEDPERRRSSPAPGVELGAVERIVRERTEGLEGIGRPLSPRARQAQRSVEAYLSGANNPPRWMERVAEIDNRIRRERRELEAERRALRERFGDDREGFARAWRAFARTRDYRELNELIREHNEWFPIERDLPVDPRTGEWIAVHGRSHLRPLLGPEWVLAEYPAE
jgi:hypothetical protein